MRLLFVTAEICWPLATGGHIRQWNVLQALKKCGDVDVVVFGDSGQLAEPAYQGCRQVFPLPRNLLRFSASQQQAYASTVGRTMLALGSWQPFEFVGGANKALASWFASLVDREKYDVIWMADALPAQTLGWSDPVRTILDADDVEFVREYDLCRSGPWYGAKCLSYLNVLKLFCWERQLTRRFARVVRCSAADQALLPGHNVVVVLNGTTINGTPRMSGSASRVLFLGALGYVPNRAGIEWFVERIWPKVRVLVPHAALDIVGGQPSATLLAKHGSDGIHVHGFVEDLTPLFQSAALSIAPLRAGCGTKLKVLESLAHGVPVVSTTIGASGLSLGAEEGVVVADSPEDFAQQCAALLGNVAKGRALAARGKATVAAVYNWNRIQDRIVNLVHDVARKRNR